MSSTSTIDTSAMDRVLRDAVGAGHAPNVVAVAADRDGIIYEGAAGPRAAGAPEPVSADSHFRIMSMTKMVGTVAALQLRDRGELEFDAPIDTYRPEFADIQVLEGFDGENPVLRPPASRATVAQLVTHTSGLSYWFWNADILKWEQATGTPNVLAGKTVIFDGPMVADPGTTFEYGINTDWLGRVVEAASGKSLDVYFKENITGPLGMAETTFVPSAEQRANLVPVHVQDKDGTWAVTEIDLPTEPEYYTAGHGLYSTPRDYLKFQRMLLGGGTLDGVEVLQQSTVDEAFTNQVGEMEFPAHIPTADPATTHELDLGPGLKWGWGLVLTTAQQPGMRAPGSGAWAGLCNTHFWVDPASGIAGAIYSQSLPFVPPGQLQMYADFERALYASL
ncbi:serine hydrolase domain-containing protein [Amycolatopsis sp. NPDC050768]|uniref:serine hydrolase domain-containing protein n=1 Tax=Amycolatopsis sp. NPDC050768 TaxID=3154839 RepID=UPI0033FA375C